MSACLSKSTSQIILRTSTSILTRGLIFLFFIFYFLFTYLFYIASSAASQIPLCCVRGCQVRQISFPTRLDLIYLARSHPQRLDLINSRLDLTYNDQISSTVGQISSTNGQISSPLGQISSVYQIYFNIKLILHTIYFQMGHRTGRGRSPMCAP